MPAQYPLPAFHFTVQWGGTRIGFFEVAGLMQENQAIEYCDGSFPEYSSIKMPGLRKFTNITLKRGIIKSDNDFFKWLSTVKLNTVERRDIVISLLNEKHEPVMVWKAQNAFPVKVEGPALKASGNEVAIETIELAHEGLELQNDQVFLALSTRQVRCDMANYYPPVGFHFKVEVLGLPPNDHDVRFTEVSGLSLEMGTEEVAEGGENRFIQKYPTRAKYPELVLKRGLLGNSEVWNWARQCIEDYQIEPKSVDVKLLNDSHQPLMTWHLVGAYPTKWAITDLSASNNAVVIESLQLYYQYFTVDRS